MVPDTHRSEPTLEDHTKGAVPVTNDVAWCAVPTDSFDELVGDPFCCRVRCGRRVEYLSPVVAHHNKSMEQLERDRRYHEQIHGNDAFCVFPYECLPCLRRWFSRPVNVLGESCLADIDTEFEHFPVDPG